LRHIIEAADEAETSIFPDALEQLLEAVGEGHVSGRRDCMHGEGLRGFA
jgi:hypothetical protein